MAGKKGKSGRKKKSYNRRNTLQILTETSPKAAAYLRDVAEGNIPNIIVTYTRKDGSTTEEEKSGVDPLRMDACKYIINQDVGMPKQKTEVTGKDGAPITFIIGRGYADGCKTTV